MGYQNYPKLFFGSILTYEEFVKVVLTFAPNIDSDDEYEIRDFYEKKLHKILDEKYEGVVLSVAAPYYDTEFQNCTFYISLFSNNQDREKMDVESVKQILNSSNITYIKFFVDLELEYRDPEFIAICNVR